MTTRKIEPHGEAVSELEDGTIVEAGFPDEEDSGENVLDWVSPRKLLIQEWDDLPTNTGDARTARFVSSIHGNRLSTHNQEADVSSRIPGQTVLQCCARKTTVFCNQIGRRDARQKGRKKQSWKPRRRY